MFCYVLLNVLGAKRGFIFNEVIAAGKKNRIPLDRKDTSVHGFSSLIAIAAIHILACLWWEKVWKQTLKYQISNFNFLQLRG